MKASFPILRKINQKDKGDNEDGRKNNGNVMQRKQSEGKVNDLYSWRMLLGSPWKNIMAHFQQCYSNQIVLQVVLRHNKYSMQVFSKYSYPNDLCEQTAVVHVSEETQNNKCEMRSNISMTSKNYFNVFCKT